MKFLYKSACLQYPRNVFFVAETCYQSEYSRPHSYTPIKLLIRAGTSLYDLQDVKTVTMDKPTGWITFDVGAERSGKDGYRPLNVYAVQIVIAANHMNGKDTHVRGLKVLGAKEATLRDDDMLPFTSQEFKMHEFVR